MVPDLLQGVNTIPDRSERSPQYFDFVREALWRCGGLPPLLLLFKAVPRHRTPKPSAHFRGSYGRAGRIIPLHSPRPMRANP